jgi:hypothetical protein
VDLTGLRTLASSISFDTHGVPAEILTVSTRVVWLSPTSAEVPAGAGFQRAELRRTMAVPLADVPALPRGTIVRAPESTGGTVKAWRVDSTDGVTATHTRVVVVPA